MMCLSTVYGLVSLFHLLLSLSGQIAPSSGYSICDMGTLRLELLHGKDKIVSELFQINFKKVFPRKPKATAALWLVDTGAEVGFLASMDSVTVTSATLALRTYGERLMGGSWIACV